MARQKLLPQGFGDFLAVLSFSGFLFIFLDALEIADLSLYTTSLFLILSGIALMIRGKILTFNKWIIDGLQQNEFNQTIVLILGVFSVGAGILALPNVSVLSAPLPGIIAISSAISMGFIMLQYFTSSCK